MIRTVIFVAATAVAAILPQEVAAQVSLEANGARADSEWGAELGVGFDLGAGGFTLRPGGGLFVYPGENERYYFDEFDNGNSQCRDTTNGQFVDSERCNNTELRAYARVEATYTITGGAEFGIGGRYSGSEVSPYGTLSFPVSPKLKVKANAGNDYYALGLRASL